MSTEKNVTAHGRGAENTRHWLTRESIINYRGASMSSISVLQDFKN